MSIGRQLTASIGADKRTFMAKRNFICGRTKAAAVRASDYPPFWCFPEKSSIMSVNLQAQVRMFFL